MFGPEGGPLDKPSHASHEQEQEKLEEEETGVRHILASKNRGENLSLETSKSVYIEM